MVKVAVAGGSGGVGRHIAEALIASKKHTVVVLSRSSPHPELEALGAKVFKVNYDDHGSLVSALDGVHTVISTILTLEPGGMTKTQLALLRAAVEVGAKRFAPSEFAVRGIPDDVMVPYRSKPVVAEAVAKSGLEWTIFENGVFMNFFANGTPGIAHITPVAFVVDVKNGTARIPNNGGQKITFTRGEDIGAFVVASLDLPKWPERSGMAGDVKTYNEVIALAEKFTGRKFSVTYLTDEMLRQEMDPNPPDLLTNFFPEAMIVLGYGGRFYFEANLNSLCPGVKPMGVSEFMRTWWGGEQNDSC